MSSKFKQEDFLNALNKVISGKKSPALHSSFETWLNELGFKPHTITQHKFYAEQFAIYLNESSLTIQQINYTEILDYADYLKKQDKGVNLINRMMLALRYYFDFLQYSGQIIGNPATGINLKGTIRTVPHDLLNKTELEALYHSYQIVDERTHRNKVIIGLLVYQAFTRQELETIMPIHVQLREGQILIPATGRQNKRLLNLQPFQILDLQEYMLIIRPRLQDNSIRLFTGRLDNDDLKNTLLHLFYALKRINPKVKHAQQIRQSVITEWLKEKDLRVVQYMAGHRYVSSTERYRESNLEELKDALYKHHPFARL